MLDDVDKEEGKAQLFRKAESSVSALLFSPVLHQYWKVL
jgi:hypothetical protein